MRRIATWLSILIVVGALGVWYLTPLRSPTHNQMVGRYLADFAWGSATLTLNPDGTYSQVVRANASHASEQITGRWTLDRRFQARVSLQPYLVLEHDGPKDSVAIGDLGVESWGFRRILITVDDPDLGLGFRKQ